MTQINNIYGSSPNGVETPTNGRKELSKDDFIKIFLAQMKLQSPLKPYDSSAMLQQMSQLTSLSATEELQSTIKNLNYNLGKSQVLSASQLIGKSVQVPSEVSPYVKGEGLRGSVILPTSASNIEISIKNAKGELVHTINKGSSNAGVLDFQWDGKDEQGNELEPDYYQISASANIDGQRNQLITAGTFKVESVALNPTQNNVILNVDGLGGMDMNDIIKII